jgi:tight adherence protein B
MGALIGLSAGIGVLLIGLALLSNSPTRARRDSRVAQLIQSAAVPNVTPKTFYSATVISGVLVGTLVLVIFAVPIVAFMSAVAGAFVPFVILKRRAKTRVKALRTSWPDAVDTLSSAVRAGMSLPEALADLSKRGPIELRYSFSHFADSYRATGSFGSSLAVLQKQMSDPVADRVIAALRIAQDVGGTDLGQVLRTLSALLRQDATTRGDIEARQSWTVSAARMSIAAPWLTLALLCTRPEAVAAFSTALGALVLLGAAGISFLAYRLMIRLGRLPSDERVIGVPA